MNIPFPVLIAASGLWVVLLLGCVLFIGLALKFRKSGNEASRLNKALSQQLEALKQSAPSQQPSPQDTDSDVPLNQSDASVAFEENALLKQKVALLEAELANVEGAVDDQPDDTLVSRLRLDKLNEKYKTLQSTWETTNQSLIRADAKIAELLGAKAALEKECDMLERKLASISDKPDESDANLMREVIINFTEDSRELLQEIEKLNTQKAELQQQIDDMEEGGKGTAGKVVGLQRKLDEAEAELEALKAARA